MHTVGITDGIAPSLLSTDYKDPPTVTLIGGGYLDDDSADEQKGGDLKMGNKNTVRRLTPL